MLATRWRPGWPELLVLLAVTGLGLAGHAIVRQLETPRPERIQVRVIELDAARVLPPLADDVIVPCPFADARAWPRGMVIAPPATHDRGIQLARTEVDQLAAVLAEIIQLALPHPAS